MYETQAGSQITFTLAARSAKRPWNWLLACGLAASAACAAEAGPSTPAAAENKNATELLIAQGAQVCSVRASYAKKENGSLVNDERGRLVRKRATTDFEPGTVWCECRSTTVDKQTNNTVCVGSISLKSCELENGAARIVNAGAVQLDNQGQPKTSTWRGRTASADAALSARNIAEPTGISCYEDLFNQPQRQYAQERWQQARR